MSKSLVPVAAIIVGVVLTGCGSGPSAHSGPKSDLSTPAPGTSGEPQLPGDNSPPSVIGTQPTVVSGPPPDCTQPTAPRAPLRRLTRFEYNNTVRDLLGITSNPADVLPGEERGSGFGNDADALGVSRLLVDGYQSIAASIASSVAGTATLANSLTGCDPAALGESACFQAFLGSFGARAFRRPLEPQEATSLQALFDVARQGRDFAAGVRAVVERVLQSPQFLYRIEFGEPVEGVPGVARPTASEMASRLSYLMWGSMPDSALLEAASQGRLRTKAEVQAQAARLLADERAKHVLRKFHGTLLGIDGLDFLSRPASDFPTFKPGMGSLFRKETETFVEQVVWADNGDLRELWTAPYTYLNEPLAAFYGIPGITGDAFTKVALDPLKRRGMLTQASILSATSPGSRTNPIVRGKWVFTKVLCGSIPDPPANIPDAPPVMQGVSTRERLARHRADPACSGCHAMLDPIGFGLENFDGVGLWRDQDNGLPVDASGEIPTTDAAGPFRGGVELAQKLSTSLDVQHCYTGAWMTFAYGRAITPSDACSRASLEAAFAQSNGNIRDLWVALTQTDAFLYRPLIAPVQ